MDKKTKKKGKNITKVGQKYDTCRTRVGVMDEKRVKN